MLFDIIDEWVSHKLDCGEDIDNIISALNDVTEEVKSFDSVEERFNFITDVDSISDNLRIIKEKKDNYV